jgi:hypothetical protein
MEPIDAGKVKDKDHDKQDLTLQVFAPRKTEPREFVWPKTTKVADAAEEAAKKFGYTGSNAGLQLLQSDGTARMLDNNKTLIAEHLKDGDQLEVTSTGGGV